MTENETLYCVNHPNRETLLRCNKCEQPICIECAVLTPTGYRCKACIREQQKKFNTAVTSDYFLAPLIAAFLSFIGSNLVAILGFFFLFVTPFISMAIDHAIRLVIKNRRSNALFIATAAGGAIGSLPLLVSHLYSLFPFIKTASFSLYMLLPIIWQGAYTILITSTIYYRLKGFFL